VTASPEPAAAVRHERRAKITPLAPQRFAFQATIDQEGRVLVQRALELMANEVPSGDLGILLVEAFKALVEKKEKQMFGATNRARKVRRTSTKNRRHIPKHVKRAVFERDGGQCTYESEDGRRCTKRTHLEYDHILEFARGGEATVDNLRLRCRGHNQFTAEQTYGADFMDERRRAARGAALPAQRAIS
jgi:hypothetical protein